MHFYKVILITMCLLGLKTVIAANYNSRSLNPVTLEKTKESPSTLILNGKASAVIIIPKRSNDYNYVQQPYVKAGKGKIYRLGISGMAASELQKMLKKCTGVKLPIITAGSQLPKNRTLILVGESELSRKFGISNDDIPSEGFKVEVFSKGVAIIGAQPQHHKEGGLGYNGLYSTLFGVYDFLERFAGVRFYYPGADGVITPKATKLIIPPVKYVDFPRYEKRQMIPWSASGMHPLPDCTINALRYRSGGHGKLGANKTWNHVPFSPCATGCPKALDKKGHPQKWRIPPQMPCYGNPKTLAILMKSYDDALHKRGELKEWRTSKGNIRGFPNSDILPFSPPDRPIQCSCKYCSKLIDERAPFHAQASPLMSDFVERLAKAIKLKWPNKTLFYLPYYNYTSAPADLKFPDNVFVQVCLLYGNSLYSNPKIHRYTNEWIRSWRKTTGRPVHVYTYPMWPKVDSPFPYQYPHEIQKFTRDFRNDVNGAFLCGPGTGGNGPGSGNPGIKGGVWAYQMPTIYCWFRLMWNPDFDVDAALKEMTNLLYGQAAEPMGRIMQTLINCWEKQDSSKLKKILDFGPYRPGKISKEELYNKIITAKHVKQLRKDLNIACKAVPANSVYRRRIDFFGNTLRLFFLDYKTFKQGLNNQQVPTAVASYIVKKTIIDGQLNEAFWEKTPSYYFVNSYLSHNHNPPNKTELKLAYNDSGILLGFRMEEPEITRARTHPQACFKGNSIEIILEYLPKRIYHFILDSQNNIMDNFRGQKPKRRENYTRRKAFIGKDFWSAEIFIPFKTLDAEMNFKPSKANWKANFIRNRVIFGDMSKHHSRWNTRFKKSNFDSKAFGKIKFKAP